MSHVPSAIRRAGAPVLGAVALALAAGCGDPADPTGAVAAGAREAAAINAQVAALPAAANGDLARLRATVARLHDFEEIQARWSVRLEPCFESGDGGMGLHMINPDYMSDAAVLRADQPEALLFEQQKNGRMRFVGVEFIVPYSVVPRDAAPPEQFGQQYRRNDLFQLWALHVWVGRHNPSGLFADWNPTVSCEYYVAPDARRAVAAARHH